MMPVDTVVTLDLNKQGMSFLENAVGSLLGEKKITNRYHFDLSHGSALITIDWYSLGVQKSLAFLKQNKKINLLEVIVCDKKVYYI